VRGTHCLERAERRTSEDLKRKRATGTHNLKRAERQTSEDMERKSEGARVTHVLESAGQGQVRTRKESKRGRGTHSLEGVEQGTGEDTGRKQTREGHSLTGEGRATDR
jgi:hypothetical protein